MQALKRAGKYYHIEVRPRESFIGFMTHDVGEKGHLMRIAGKKASGVWETAAWLVDKDDAHISEFGNLIIHDPRASTVLNAIYGPIVQKKGDFFKAIPRYSGPIRPTWSIDHSLAK